MYNSGIFLLFLLFPYLFHYFDAVSGGNQFGACPVTGFRVRPERPEDYQLDDFGDNQLFHRVLGFSLEYPKRFVVQRYGYLKNFFILKY